MAEKKGFQSTKLVSHTKQIYDMSGIFRITMQNVCVRFFSVFLFPLTEMKNGRKEGNKRQQQQLTKILSRQTFITM